MRGLVVIALLATVIAGSMFLYVNARISSFVQSCEAQGGHNYSLIGGGTRLCLTSDGRILEVHP